MCSGNLIVLGESDENSGSFLGNKLTINKVLRTEALHLNPSKIYKNFCPTWIVTVFKYKYTYNIYKICLVHVEGQCLIFIFF